MEHMEKDFFGASEGSAFCGKMEVNERLHLSDSVHENILAASTMLLNCVFSAGKR